MSETAIRLEGVGKMYKMFSSRKDNFLDALGLDRFLPRRRPAYREFWALRGIDLELGRAERIGVIGRNGAGKTTLLRLITGNVPVSEGNVIVNGRLQALLDASGGLHPEFTGRENIRAALTYQGLSGREIAAAEDDIAEFTELGEFLEQPFKTYSLGMQARLGFAIATTVRPEILIVDEVLGAGDAYFFSKSTARMRELVESGASVLIVSHALDQIVRFCETSIWLERGRIVERGPTLDVVKTYEQFIRTLEDRRLRAKNRKMRAPEYAQEKLDAYADNLIVRVLISGDDGDACDVARMRLLRDGEVEDEVRIGDAQDSDESQSAFLLSTPGDGWSRPIAHGDTWFRRLELNGNTAAWGSVLFYLYAFLPDSRYSVELDYRTLGRATAQVELVRNGVVEAAEDLRGDCSDWTVHRVQLPQIVKTANGRSSASASDTTVADASPRGTRRPTRWPGGHGLAVEDVVLLGSDGREGAVFNAGMPLTLEFYVRALEDGRFRAIPAAVLFRLDGVLVSRFIGQDVTLDVRRDERRRARLSLATLNLGNGHYVFSLALYRKLDLNDIEEPEIYDLMDRSYEFQVIGVPALKTGVFQHPGEWTIT